MLSKCAEAGPRRLVGEEVGRCAGREPLGAKLEEGPLAYRVDAVSCEHRLAPALRGQGLEDSRPVGVPASSAPCGTAQASEGRG